MKRRDRIRHLESEGCELLREGGRHSVYVNRRTRKVSTVPRHRENNEHLARKICRDLEVALPAAWRTGRSAGAGALLGGGRSRAVAEVRPGWREPEQPKHEPAAETCCVLGWRNPRGGNRVPEPV